jgi:hypothetical protein
VIIVGSQAILGTYAEDQLPFYATRSAEIDVIPIADDAGEIDRLADEIDGVAAEFSPFAQLHGFAIDGVDLNTSATTRRMARSTGQGPEREHGRPSGQPQYTGGCLDKEDLCVAKLCALREKDENFVDALITANLIDPQVIATRLATTPQRHRKLLNEQPRGSLTA